MGVEISHGVCTRPRMYRDSIGSCPDNFDPGLPKPNGKPQFKFELGWLTRDGFAEMVKHIWDQPVGGASPI